MMDTVLNLGLNDESVQGLAEQTGTSASRSTRTAASCRCSARSCSTSPATPSRTPSRRCARSEACDRPELDADDLRGLVETFKGIVQTPRGHRVPAGAHRAARHAIEAVFRSWNGDRARIYRQMENIPDDLGTAVNVQTMVFGNKGEDSGTGVAFTRDPATGENRPYGDFLANAQGEDVVAGIRITEPLERDGRTTSGSATRSCSTVMDQLADPLPRHVRHRVHDRAGSPLHPPDPRGQAHGRAPRCAWRSRWRRRASSTQREAVLRVQPEQLDQLLHPQFDPTAEYTALAKGLNASPGAAVGKVYFTADVAEAEARRGRARHPRAARDVARRPPRDDRRRGHPHVARRAREPRRRGCPRHGHAGGVRRVRRSTSIAKRRVHASATRSCAKARSSRSTAAPARWSSVRCR